MYSKFFAAIATLSLLAGFVMPVRAANAPLQPDIAALDRMQIYAAQALANAEEARAALHDGTRAQLTSDLDRVRTLLSLIRSRMPAAEFHAILRAVRALMDFQDNKQILPLFPKLFYALDDLPAGAAVDRARGLLKQAEDALRKPDRAGALRALDHADAEFANPVLTPPLNAAGHDLSAAFAALDSSGNGASPEPTLKRLANDLAELHRALATYPLDMAPTAPVSQD